MLRQWPAQASSDPSEAGQGNEQRTLATAHVIPRPPFSIGAPFGRGHRRRVTRHQPQNL
jgi:hypothetical protein